MTPQITNSIGATQLTDLSPPEPVMAPQQASSLPLQLATAAMPTDSAAVTSTTGPQMESQLADALKKVGITAEINFNKSGYVVVQYVDPQSQQVVFQIPAQGVLDMVANLSRVLGESDPAVAGAMFDQRA